MNEQINNYVKEGLSKGYTEEQLKQILVDHKVPPQDITDAFNLVHGLSAQNESIQQKPHDRLYSWMLILGGLFLMIAGYIYKIFQNINAESTEELSAAMNIVYGFWPLAFPICANIANRLMFRRRFLFGLIFTIVIILALVGFIVLMSLLTTPA